jgi:hypothetical protein
MDFYHLQTPLTYLLNRIIIFSLTVQIVLQPSCHLLAGFLLLLGWLQAEKLASQELQAANTTVFNSYACFDVLIKA